MEYNCESALLMRKNPSDSTLTSKTCILENSPVNCYLSFSLAKMKMWIDTNAHDT